MVKTYRTLREETTARDRSLHEKVVSLEEAAALVSDGDHVAVGGCTMSRTPIALIWALIRAGRKDLTVSRSIVSTEGDLLYGSGASRHIITSWFSQGIVWGVSKVMRHYTEGGRAQFEEWSHMSIGLRYRAGAMGLPFMPTRSMLGSGVRQVIGETAREMICPFTGEQILLLPALNPDVALLHVQRADAYGNAQIDGLQFMDLDIAMAARKVILATERIVSNDQIRRQPDRTKIPLLHGGSRGRNALRGRTARMLRRLRALLPPSRRLCRGDQGRSRRRLAGLSEALLRRTGGLERLPRTPRHGRSPGCRTARTEHLQ